MSLRSSWLIAVQIYHLFADFLPICSASTEMSSCNLGFVCFNGSRFECKYLLLFISLGILFCSPSSPSEWGAALQSTFNFSWRSVHCCLSTAFSFFFFCPFTGSLCPDHSGWVLLHSHMKDSRSILWHKKGIWGSVHVHVALLKLGTRIH